MTLRAVGSGVALLLVLGCASSTRARIELPDPNGRVESWTDVLIAEKGERAQALCETLIERELRTLRNQGISHRVAQPCDTGSLTPPAGASPNQYVLIQRMPVDPEALPLSAQGEGETKLVENTQLTRTARYDSERECERARALLQQADALEAAVARDRGAAFLHQQETEAEARRTAACGERDRLRIYCGKVSSPSERAECDQNLARADQSCAAETELLARTRHKSFQVAPAEPAPEVVCRLESQAVKPND